MLCRGSGTRSTARTAEFYILDRRHSNGKCALWWATAGRGWYVTNLDNAGRFTEKELAALSLRPTDVPIQCNRVDAIAARHVLRITLVPLGVRTYEEESS